MRVTHHGEHLTQLTRARISNCYLVDEEDGATLVDTSFSSSGPQIVALARRSGRTIRRIALTHAHHDHAGALEPLHRLLPDAQIAVGAREATLLAGDVTTGDDEPAGRLHAFLYERCDVRPDRLLADGDRVGSLRVVAAPGHTPGHLAFLDERDGTHVCGDAYLTVGEVFVASELRLRFPLPALAGTWHAATTERTALALADLEPTRLATGHGPVVERPGPSMRRALERVRSAVPG